MKRKIQSLLFFCFLFFLFSISFFAHRYQINSYGVITGIKDTLSNPQLSYFGRLSSVPIINDSLIQIVVNNTGFTAPSLSTNNLFVGDTIAIGTTGLDAGSSGPLTLYTIRDLGDTASIQLNSGIGQSNAFAGAAVIATRSSVHTISFNATGNITSSFWQVLIKATSRIGETHNDGIPDQQGFDLGQDVGGITTGLGTRLKIADVSCPNFVTGVGVTEAYSIGTTTLNGNTYHTITCYQGVGGTTVAGVGYTITIGRDLSTGSQLINPAPTNSSHIEGNADVYTFFVRHLDASETIQDQTQGKIAVVEAVRVTASIDPTLTFTIGTTDATHVGGTACETIMSPNANATTSDSVAFGSLFLNQANNLAQILSAVTNASGGYVVTAYANDYLRNVTTGTTIPNTTCPSAGSCDMITPAPWTTYTDSGFGYTLQNLSVGTSIFNYQDGYKSFGIGYANTQEIMKNNATPIAIEQAYICYRATASTTQEAGNYESKLIFTATATF